jgi:hypothetical protein
MRPPARAPDQTRGVRWIALSLLVLAIGFGCTSSKGPNGPPSGLPDYTPEEAALFDDMLPPRVFGVEVEEIAPTRDRKLAERTRYADFVVAVRVSTLTREGAEEKGAYVVTVEPVQPAFAGYTPQGAFDILVPFGNPSYRLLHANRHAWVGTRLVLFGRRYNLSGMAALHWRAEPDTPEMRAAITEHALLR